MSSDGVATEPAADTGLGADAATSLMRAVTSARWFAGKGRRAELRSFTPLPWLNDAAAGADDAEVPRVRLAVLEVGYPDEAGVRPSDALGEGEEAAPGVEHYQLALAYRSRAEPTYASAELFTDGHRTVYDATQDVAGARVLLDALLESRDLGSDGSGADQGPGPSSVRFHLDDASALSADLVPQVFRGQQSNTSVMFGDVAILKLFRRLELGRNLDIQVHAALNQAGVADVARLYGWADATWTRGGEVLGADLAMCVEKLAGAEDGWDLALASLEGESRRAAATPDDAPGFRHHAEALGRALALTHDALRTAFGQTDQPGDAVADVMGRRLDAAVTVAPALEPYVAGLGARFAALDGTHLDAQRVHGDFHLGQTLHTPSGWKIIDFEGEPAKSLAERVAPDSVWRDVAGMMRSFDYAAASVPGAVGTAWRDACRDGFLDGYTGGHGLAPDAAHLLAAYEADKAVYEVVYEVRNRPDWVGIPLGAVAALAAGPPEPADDTPDPRATTPRPTTEEQV